MKNIIKIKTKKVCCFILKLLSYLNSLAICQAGFISENSLYSFDTIDEAYYNGVHKVDKNIIEYTTKSGMEIQVNLNDSGKIVSAYPKYQ